jgi:hypothetical protein
LLLFYSSSRYVGDPGFQTGVGEDLGIQQSTVCKTFHAVTDKVVDKSSIWVHFPATQQEMQEAKEKWAEKFFFPGAIGVIDGTHVYINRRQVITRMNT